VLATTVADAALALSVLADRPELATVARSGRLRVAVSIRSPLAGTTVDKHWAAATRETADLLRGAGHAVTEADPPYRHVWSASASVRWMAGTELEARTLVDRDRLCAAVRRHAAVGRAAMRFGLPRAKGRDRWQDRALRFFADYDVLITPALARPPIQAKAWSQRGWIANLLANARYAPFAAPWNLAGFPATAVPAGLDPRGLPLGVQLVAPSGTEARLLSLAAQLEELRPWPRTANR
jgi:amidase